MKRLRDILEITLLVCFIAFILLVCYFTIHGARKVKALGDEASAALTNLNRTVVIAAGAFSNLEKGARSWKENSDSQASLSTDALKRANEALRNLSASAKSLDYLITSTNNSLNVSLLPSLSRAISDQNNALLATETQAISTLADADRVVANPRISESIDALADSIDALADSSKSVALATASGAATMQKVQQGVEYEVNQLEKPVKKVKVIFLFILTALGHFFGYA
jgi:hypothetical protein